MLNKSVLIGRLTKDPELRQTSSDKEVCSFKLAVDRDFKNAAGEKEADFIPVIVWGKTADLCSRYLSKGKMAAVAGRLQLRNYEDKEGNKRLAAEVVADNVWFLSPVGDRQQAPAEPEPLYEDNEELPF